ncbi:hypothetical protein KFK14_11245 [Sphingobium phenoxybenzoativorans]|uniref:Uncharacterized protein n=1 Tax=Sphingobium phenoxybenzoativorans TaxID=1592790 RepID=A0A975KAN3_9SPHN|nr:hypothetical protein [Sphingobium phenoxybenzoativorans]QUT07904.1 hypothetical protein KFK14_11245 [Sphingobium phenoxybenzoativorans]
MIDHARLACLAVWSVLLIWAVLGARYSPLRLIIAFQCFSAIGFMARRIFAPNDTALWIGCYVLSALVAFGFFYVGRAYDNGSR